MRPGELDQRVEFERPVYADDGQGGSVKSWESVDADFTWARVRPLRGGERSHSELLQASGGYMVIVRNRQDVNETWRIRWLDRGRVMNITFVSDPGPRDLYLPIECERGVAT